MAAVDGTLTDGQRQHAAGCDDCSAALREATAFDRELGAAMSELAGPALPPSLLDPVPTVPSRRAWLPAAMVLGLVLLGGGMALGRTMDSFGTAPEPFAGATPYTLHVVVSNHRQLTLSVEVEAATSGTNGSVTSLLPGCHSTYVAIPLPERWRVRVGDYSFAAGPPNAAAGSATDDVTVRITTPAGGAQVVDGTPEDHGLDVSELAAATVAPCP
ncbi:MAG: hypothetical protein ACRDHD_04340 [Candidatus Limnocylindria bacterium]